MDAPNLTIREWEVANLLADTGWSNRQIAHQLEIEVATVKHHLGQISRKTGLHTRGQIIVWIWKEDYTSYKRFHGG